MSLGMSISFPGGKPTQAFPRSSTARQFTGGVALTDEQVKQIQYQKEVSVGLVD